MRKDAPCLYWPVGGFYLGILTDDDTFPLTVPAVTQPHDAHFHPISNLSVTGALTRHRFRVGADAAPPAGDHRPGDGGRADSLGVQADLWGERMKSFPHVLYMTYPGACALAEVAWSPDGPRDYAGFFKRVQTQFKRLDAAGINYRQPTATDQPE